MTVVWHAGLRQERTRAPGFLPQGCKYVTFGLTEKGELERG